MKLGVVFLALVPALTAERCHAFLVKSNLASVRRVRSDLHRLAHHTEKGAVEGIVVVGFVKIIVITRERRVGLKPSEQYSLNF